MYGRYLTSPGGFLERFELDGKGAVCDDLDARGLALVGALIESFGWKPGLQSGRRLNARCGDAAESGMSVSAVTVRICRDFD
jgi:hypothetical protein